MRITVRRVLEILATYPNREEIFREYPFLEPEDLEQALRYAAAAIDEEVHSLNTPFIAIALSSSFERFSARFFPSF